MLRYLMLLLALLLIVPAGTAEADAPATLRECDTLREAEAFIIYPPEDGLAGVTRGYIRLVSQHRAGDDTYRFGYWLGGEPGSELDLNLQEDPNGRAYNFFSGTMCTRTAYSMALSYLGVDVTPGDMSRMTGLRDLDPPYDEVSQMVGVELVQPKAYQFDTMVENYLTDPDYSPVYVYLRKPDGKLHTVLIIGRLPEKGQYIVLDPGGMWVDGEQSRIYMMAFNKNRTEVINSTFRYVYVGSRVMSVCQWRLVPEEKD